MSTPLKNPEGYASSSVMTHVPSFKGKLMLVHGLIDENVHFRHTARLINVLIKYRKRYELVLFPDERHSPHNVQGRIYIEDIVHDFFCQYLQPSLSSSLSLPPPSSSLSSSVLQVQSSTTEAAVDATAPSPHVSLPSKL